MTLQILAILGSAIAGYCAPEMAVLLGSGKHPAPPVLNIFCATSAGFIASYIVLAT